MMNNKISFYTPPYSGISNYCEMIDIAAEHGISSIEGFCIMDFAEPDKDAARRVREYADSKNIRFSCFSVFVNLVGEDSEDNIARMKEYADVAAILGSPYLHHTIACEFAEPQNIIPYKDELFVRGINAVREIYDYADSIGVRCIYEEQGYLFNGVEGFSRFLSAVDRNVGVVADVANIYQCGEEIYPFIEKFGDRVVHAHIKDITLTETNPDGLGLATLDGKYMNEAVIGEGIVDIKRCTELLRSKGYDGYWGIEYGFRDRASSDIYDALNFVDACVVYE